MNIFFGALLFCFSILAHAGDSLAITVGANQNSFVVKLPANPTTGFQWKVVQFDKNLLTLSNSQYQKAQTNLIGAGGQMAFTFTLNNKKNLPEKTKMTFKYSRSWEPGTATVKKVVVNFVHPNSNELQ